MKLKGKITIAKTTNQDNKHMMHFEIMDEASHLRFDVMMTMENFAIAITGQGYMPCELEMPEREDFDILGKTMENKQVAIPFENDPPIGKGFKEWFEKLIYPYEAEALGGWKADKETSMNFHKLQIIKTSVNMKTYTVTFRRWV